MIPLVLAAAVAAGGELQEPTLAGVTLGSNLTQVLSEYPGAQRSANPGQRWVWSRRRGGTVTVTADDLGNITRVDFVADKGPDNDIDLPCVGAFPVRDSDVSLNLALGKTPCGAFNGAAYALPFWQLVFPAVYLQPPRQGATEITAVRQIFRDDPNVTVMQDRDGMLRITIGSVSTAILQTRIQTLALDPIEQYSAPSAVVTIENAPELRTAERRLDVHLKQGMINIIVSGPIPGAPHLPKLMQNVTADEALDSVARTFKGIVTYGICKQPDGKSLFQFGSTYGS
jgi:hypothetical protein